MLVIYNSKTKKKELFRPIHTGKINMYVCGITVYDYCHLGHARSMVIFDIIYRFLRFLGFSVNYVRNITDIEDKIIKRAKDNQQTITELTNQMIQAMDEDFASLDNLKPTQEPRATDYIPQMYEMIQTLIDKGFAYQGDSGNVYYAVNKFDRYGQLSNQHLDELSIGERVAVATDKKNPLDFVLWKCTDPLELHFDSPWGKGRPGWHLECSVMSCHCLANDIDIHGGGMDLLFPHHENEVAQSEAYLNKKFVNYWIHSGFLNINDNKMSKSLGNFLTIRDALQKYHGETIRYSFLTTHYRRPFNYTEKGLAKAHSSLESLYTALRFGQSFLANEKKDLPLNKLFNDPFFQNFMTAMNDDFNTPQACAVLFDLAHHLNRLVSQSKTTASNQAIVKASILLKQLGKILGILKHDPTEFIQQGFIKQNQTLTIDQIEALIQKRQQARKTKNWQIADRIRDDLQKQGILVEDDHDKTIWRRLSE